MTLFRNRNLCAIQAYEQYVGENRTANERCSENGVPLDEPVPLDFFVRALSLEFDRRVLRRHGAAFVHLPEATLGVQDEHDLLEESFDGNSYEFRRYFWPGPKADVFGFKDDAEFDDFDSVDTACRGLIVDRRHLH